MQKDGHIKFILPILAISCVGFLSVAMHFQYRKRAMKVKKIIPQLLLTDSGRMNRIERFSHYVARQMGFGDMKECPQLCKLAYDYLTKSKGCEDNIYVYFSSEPNADSLCMKLIEEFDKCILAYFAFHWSHAPHMISQVLSVDSETKPKLKDIVMAATRFCYTHRWAGKFRYQHMFITAGACTSSLATYHGRLQSLDHLHKWGPVKRYMVVILSRSIGKVVVRTRRDVLKIGKQRFERVMKDLKVARVFSTLVEEMKAIGVVPSDDQHCTDVMVPAALSERSPVLFLMGGGMGAGKSTVLKDILHESFWSSTEGHAVVVEADAFKETDVIYRALNSRGHHHDMLQTAELVHQSSMDAASSLLVTALNEGRDVIMDGTLSWEPFVEQTIAMARNIHRHRYRMGVGYKTSEDGTITENYWEEVEEQATKRRPYRIELVGVVCDAYLAVVRGMRRAILNRRAVRVKSQLTSHKRFANAFPRYCQLVDKARLFSTNAMGSPPKLIGWKDGDNDMLVDPHEIDCLKRVSMLNEEANSVYELHPQAELMSISRSVWNEVVLAPSRVHLQRELKIAVQKIENPTL